MPSSPLSTWARNVTPSPTLSLTAKTKALIASGEDVCGFGAGEPDFDTPSFIKEACIQALQAGKTHYTPVAGIPELRAAIAEKYVRENRIRDITEENVVVCPGGKYACYLAILAVCSPGDEVIIPAPYWVSYPEMVKLAGATPKVIAADEPNGFKLTVETLNAAITPGKTRLLILNSPSNPTGAVYDRAELEKLMEVVVASGLYVLSDEIYEYFLYDTAVHYSPAAFSQATAAVTVTVSGFSKSYAMTGWRLGTLVAPRYIAKAVSNLQSQTTSNPTTFAQYGALATLQDREAARQAIDNMLHAFDQRRHILGEGLRAIDGIQCQRAQGAFYLFPNIASFGLTSNAFCERLLTSQKMAVVPGIAFGEDRCVRISYATDLNTIEIGLERLKAFCDHL